MRENPVNSDAAVNAGNAGSAVNAESAENGVNSVHEADAVNTADTADTVNPVHPVIPVNPPETVNPVAYADPANSTPPGPPLADPAPVTSAPPRKRMRRGRVVAVAGSVLLLAAVVAGAGYTYVTVQDADVDAGRPVYKLPAAHEAKVPAATGLRAMLLPYEGDNYTQGPDLGEYGSDAEFNGRQATALRKEEVGSLPTSQRRAVEKLIDKEKIKGMAMRSYIADDPTTILAHKGFTASVVLTRMASRGDAKNNSASQNDAFGSLSVLVEGPKIKGHPDARCFRTPKLDDGKRIDMYCSAYSGDVLISVTASGLDPLDSSGVGKFFAAQLDRIDDPGESV